MAQQNPNRSADTITVGFSNRDGKTGASYILASQAGQGLVEYVLVLVVVVAIILGGLYQLNSAFKSWANNYFGNYLACLLETGELPSISGAGGDSGLCNELFKPFSLAEGRPLVNPNPQGSEGGPRDNGGGSRERTRTGPGGQAGNYTPIRTGRFGSRFGQSQGSRFSRSGNKGGASYTGSTQVSNYGGGYGSLNRRIRTDVKQRLDNRFAFENDRDRQTRRRITASVKKGEEGGGYKAKTRLKRMDAKKDQQELPDSPMTFPDFIRFILIAAIIIALVMFLGGQMLQIGKSMER